MKKHSKDGLVDLNAYIDDSQITTVGARFAVITAAVDAMTDLELLVKSQIGATPALQFACRQTQASKRDAAHQLGPIEARSPHASAATFRIVKSAVLITLSQPLIIDIVC